MDTPDQKQQTIKPILVSGSPRSGTTWVGRMLALSPLINYIHEPFNPDKLPTKAVWNLKFDTHFTYICDENSAKYYKSIKKVMEGKYNWLYPLAHARSIANLSDIMERRRKFNHCRSIGGVTLIKDPIAIMSCEWLSQQFDISTIIMSRHPAAFVASIKRLGWGTHPENWALPQKFLMRDYLAPYEKEISALQSGNHDIIERASLAWKLHHHVIHLYKTKHNDWKFIRHEDISRDPVNGFKDLFSWTKLPFTPEIKQQINEHSGKSNPSNATAKEKPIKLNSQANISNWKSQLTPAEIEQIRKNVEDVSKYFYTDKDWALNDNENI